MQAMTFLLYKMTKSFRIFFHGRRDLWSLGLRVQACALMPGSQLRRFSAQERASRMLHPYVLHLAYRGTAEMLLPRIAKPVRLGPRHFWMVLPGEPVSYRAISEDWLHMFISFHTDLPESILQRFDPDRCVGVMQKDWTASRLFEEFAGLAQSGAPRLERQLPGILHQLLDDLFPNLPGTPGDQDQPGIEELIQRIRADLPRNWDFPQEARQLGMSYSSLRQKFRLLTGLPPQQFLIRERINFSCRFLMEGLPVQQAGERAGIPNPYYFSRLFKNLMRMPPRDYRVP